GRPVGEAELAAMNRLGRFWSYRDEKDKSRKVRTWVESTWNTSYVKAILKSRAAFGEFTPRCGRAPSSRREAAGPAIAHYCPPVITEDEFYAAQEAVTGRKVKGAGRPAKQLVNLFAGMLRDARTGGRLHLRQYAGSTPRHMVHYLAPYDRGVAAGEWVSFPL